MTVSERISLLRRSILLSRLYKKDGSRRNHIEIHRVSSDSECDTGCVSRGPGTKRQILRVVE